MSDLPVNVDTTYDDDASDASVKLHQQHHDAIHALYNDIAGATPDLANQGIEAAGAAAAAQAAAVQRANHTGTQAQSTVTNLVSDLAAKAPLASPTLTGTPAAPTATPGTNTTQVATTAFVAAATSASSVSPSPITVPAWTPATSNVNWGAASVYSLAFMNTRSQSSGAQNDEITFPVNLGTGTWSLTLAQYANTVNGIYTITIDGASLTSIGGSANTIDGYAASGVSNLTTISGIQITSAGAKAVKLKMATKNASSSNYYGQLSAITFTRTGNPT